jgi:hypothetical protein
LRSAVVTAIGATIEFCVLRPVASAGSTMSTR